MEEQRLQIRPPLWLPVLVALIASGAYIAGKYIETRDTTPLTITVQGEGKVIATPDIASLNFGVNTGRQHTAEDAMEDLSEKMNAVIAAVKEKGIEEKDIATQHLSLRPSYDWKEGERIDRGFEASQNLTVKVRDVDNIGEVLTAAASAGANQAGGVNFTIDDPELLQVEAREEALKKGKEKAQMLSEQLGKTLGKLKGFSEGGVQPVYSRAVMMDEAVGYGGGGGAPVPVPAGEQEVRVSVTMTYELR